LVLANWPQNNEQEFNPTTSPMNNNTRFRFVDGSASPSAPFPPVQAGKARNTISRACSCSNSLAHAPKIEPDANAATYLTIDLGFWSNSRVGTKFLRKVIDCVPTRHLALAVHHPSILPHVLHYGACCNRLINLDSHSDLCGEGH